MQRDNRLLSCLVILGILCIHGLAHAQRPRVMQTELPAGLVDLALREMVQRELGLAKDSTLVAELRKLSETQRKEFFEATEDQQAPLRIVAERIHAKYRPDLKRLLKPEQFDRLRQIRWQQMGLNALSDDDVVQALDITNAQQERLAAAKQEYSRAAFGRPNIPPNPATPGTPNIPAVELGRNFLQQRLEAEQGWEKSVNETLTPDQQQRFAVLKGKYLDLTVPPTVEGLQRMLPSIRIDGLVGFVLLEPVLKELGIDTDSPTARELRKLKEAMQKERFNQRDYLTPEEQDNALERPSRVYRKYDAELPKLLKPDQYVRLMQIDMQMWGTTILLRDSQVWKELGLSPEQQKQLSDLDVKFVTESRSMANFLPRPPAVNGQEARPKAETLKQDRAEKILGILTKKQQVKYAELQGKPFDLSLVQRPWMRSRVVPTQKASPK